MFWEKIWRFVQSIWKKICTPKTSNKSNTLLDTASLKLFGLDIKVTREVPINVPYELTIVVPRAELRGDKKSNNLEIILNSITIAHSPRLHSEGNEKEGLLQKYFKSEK